MSTENQTTEQPAVTPETLDYAQFETYRATGTLPTPAGATTETNEAVTAPAAADATTETSAPAAQVTPETPPEEDDDNKSISKGVQKRFDKLTKEKHELRNRIALLEQKLAEPPEAAAAAPKSSEPKPNTPAAGNVEGRPALADFQTYEAYTEAVADWKYEQRRGAERAQEAAQTTAASWNAKVAELKKVHADFEDVAYSEAVAVTDVMQRAIVESDEGPAVAYWLGSNPNESARIAKLSPARQAAEIGKIEAKLQATASTAAAPVQPVTKLSKAPPPPAPLSGQSKVTAPSLNDANLDYATFERLRSAKKK